MSTVYAKTPKGLSELESRAGGLKPKTRRVLIMIDGKRDLDEVTRLSLGDDDAVTEAIRQLLLEGYIDLAGSPATQAVRPLATTPNSLDTDEVLTAPPPVPRPASATSPPPPSRPEANTTPPPAEAIIIASTEKTGPNIAPPDPFGGLIKI